jgi:hypothetical protein
MVKVINEENLIRELTELKRRQEGRDLSLRVLLTFLLAGAGFACIRSAFQIPFTGRTLTDMIGTESLPAITRLTIENAGWFQTGSILVTAVGLAFLFVRKQPRGSEVAIVAVAMLLAGWCAVTLAMQSPHTELLGTNGG